jgi:hypothetical protein
MPNEPPPHLTPPGPPSPVPALAPDVAGLPRRPAEYSRRLPPRRGGGSTKGASPGGGSGLPEQLFGRPTSMLLYGPSRSLVNLVLYAVAKATSPSFQWVDIQVPGEQRLPADPVGLGWIEDDHRWSVDHPSMLRPDDLAANLALFALVRSDEPSASLVQITDFLRLPEISQRILAVRPVIGTPGVVAVPNAHRVMASFPAGQVPGILSAHRAAGYSVYVGFAESPGTGAELFDFVFRLDGESLSDWKGSHAICERGNCSGSLGQGAPVDLEEIPAVADVLARATSPS